MTDKTIKKIPYGLANYEQLVQQNCYYVDKTMFLPAVEAAGHYLFFNRPRRFGRSLFLSMMQAYYDVRSKERFEELFKGTWIYDYPTDERGAYLVLTFDFSAVEPEPAKMEISFINHVHDTAVDFVQRYSDFLPADRDKDYFARKVEKIRSASDILFTLLSFCQGTQHKLYVLIDGYDSYVNTILSTSWSGDHKELKRGTGSFLSFFNVLKGGTSDFGAPIVRSFKTGISPITMDDVTSGYNIGMDVTMEPDLNRMLGFTWDDVVEMIEYYRSKGKVSHPTGRLLEIMSEWYGNYLFSKDDDVRLFNPDMVLYFLDNYISRKELPDDLIDGNVRTDYGRLGHFIIANNGKAVNGNFNRLKEIVEKGEISANISRGFSFEKLTNTENFISLLYYFGLLTIDSDEYGLVKLKIPNETMKRLYYDYIERGS